MFDAFPHERRSRRNGAQINLVHGGSGPPVLLLHGSPQTHVVWHGLAPMLAESHTVVRRTYLVTAIAPYRLAVAITRRIAFGRWRPISSRQCVRWAMSASRWWGMIAGRESRIAWRGIARAVERVAFLDIVPTDYVYAHVERSAAVAFWHWFFLTLPEPIPERMIEPTAIFFLHFMLGSLGSGLDIYAPEALAEYERCFADPAAIRGMCEDYRAAGSIDLVHDAEDRDRLIRCPVLLLWGARGVVGTLYDPIEVSAVTPPTSTARLSMLAISSPRNAR